MASINNALFSFLFTSTVNSIGDEGAMSIGEVLETNTTLTQLDLSGEYKRKKVHK